jgi:hypothetical protein
MGKAPKRTFLVIAEKINGYKTKITWNFYTSALQEIAGGDLTVVFKRKGTKYTMNRSLGVSPGDTLHRGPLRNRVLTEAHLNEMLETAISTAQRQFRQPMFFGAPPAYEIAALPKFCKPGSFVEPEDDKPKGEPSF